MTKYVLNIIIIFAHKKFLLTFPVPESPKYEVRI